MKKAHPLLLLLILLCTESIAQKKQNNLSYSDTTISVVTNADDLFEKYGEEISFVDNKKVSILILKNDPSLRPRFTGYIAMHGAIIIMPIGLELNFTYDDNNHHKFSISGEAATTGLYNNLYSSRYNQTFFWYKKDLVGKKRYLNVTKEIDSPAYNTLYNIEYNRKTRYRAGNYGGIEFKQMGYLEDPSVHMSGVVAHVGFSFDWYSDFRCMFKSNKGKIHRYSREETFYFGYQHSFLTENTNLKLTTYNDYPGAYFATDGGTVGYLCKFYGGKYSVSNTNPIPHFLVLGFEGGYNAGPIMDVSNVVAGGVRFGYGF